jgi:hypothetical protein
MKALISPLEQVTDYLGNSGCRVVQTNQFAFEVADPLYWIDCPDDLVANEWYWIENGLRQIPMPPPIEE